MPSVRGVMDLQISRTLPWGDYRDQECVVDNNLITSRCPDDLPAFMGEVLTNAGLRRAEPRVVTA